MDILIATALWIFLVLGFAESSRDMVFFTALIAIGALLL